MVYEASLEPIISAKVAQNNWVRANYISPREHFAAVPVRTRLLSFLAGSISWLQHCMDSGCKTYKVRYSKRSLDLLYMYFMDVFVSLSHLCWISCHRDYAAVLFAVTFDGSSVAEYGLGETSAVTVHH